MANDLLVNIIINNYNYGNFLKDAIDSSLNQTYPCTEIIVVDDGSTDDSIDIISAYKDLITPVLKQNGGQGSAFNEGFNISRGSVIVFLDSDDLLLPTAIENAVSFFHDSDVVKVHWPLKVVNKKGQTKNQILPKASLTREI